MTGYDLANRVGNNASPRLTRLRPRVEPFSSRRHAFGGDIMSIWGKLEVERVEGPAGALVYRLTGTLTDSKDGFDFLETVREAFRSGVKRVVLNLSRLEQLDSSGVGIIASCYTSAANAGAFLALAEVPKRPRAILEIVRLLTVIPELPTEQAALAAEAGTSTS